MLYSRGPHLLRTLKQLRAEAPGDHVTAIVPPGFPTETLEGLADDVREAPRPAGLAGAWRMARGLRAERFDRFVVMFDSPRLRLLAALRGARVRECRTVEGRTIALPRSVWGTLLTAAARSLRGRLRYHYIRCIVRHRRVGR